MPLELYVKNLEQLDEPLRGFYAERLDENGNPDGYKLAVKGGVVASSVVDGLQQHRVALEKKLEKFGDRKPEDFEILNGKIEELQNALKDTKSHSSKDLEATIKPLKEEWQKKENSLTNRVAFLEAEIEKRDIDNEAARVGVAAGVIPEAIGDVTARVRGIFAMEDGKATPKDKNGNVILDPDTSQPYTIEGFLKKRLVKEAPFLFVKDTGGGAPGSSKGGGGESAKNPWKTDSSNMTEQAKILKADPAKAERLMKEAGYSQTRVDNILRR